MTWCIQWHILERTITQLTRAFQPSLTRRVNKCDMISWVESAALYKGHGDALGALMELHTGRAARHGTLKRTFHKQSELCVHSASLAFRRQRQP